MTRFSVDEHMQALADYLPQGRLFEAKNIHNSEFRKLLRGLAGELFNAQGYLTALNDEYFPDGTTLFIEEWERALGIPDDCFLGVGDIVTRRRDIVVKLAALGVQTAADFVTLAALFGVAVTVTPLSDEAILPLPVPFTPVETLASARFTVVVTGENLITNVPPYDVPFDLLQGQTVMECLFQLQTQANCNIIFRNTE